MNVFRRWAKLYTAIALFTFLQLSCSGDKSGEGNSKGRSEKNAKDHYGVNVKLKRPDGSIVRLSSLKGKIIMVNFVASWNNDSRNLIPIMNKLMRGFKGQVVVIGILLDENASAKSINALQGDYNIEFPVYLNGLEVANDFGGVKTPPTSYIIGRMGNVIHRIDGLKDKRYYQKQLEALLVKQKKLERMK
jgi:thiol-disulfide isomerase/thioredoxin